VEAENMQKIRVGVFICHCGSNIASVVNVNKVVEYSKRLPNVAYAETNLYTCSPDGLRSIKNKIEEHGLNRINSRKKMPPARHRTWLEWG
jgi:heterodisulfide reductase subunit A-like polyferredoxin